MASAFPPPSTQPATASTSKRHRRHKQHQTAPEELPFPAKEGKVDGLAPPSRETHSTPRVPRPSSAPATPTGVRSPQHASEGDMIGEEQLASSDRGGRPPLPAGRTVSGKQFQMPGTSSSADLGQIGRRDCTEGIRGFQELLPGPVDSGLPDNGDPPKSAGIWTVNASQVFDVMPLRNPSKDHVLDVQREDGEVWERGPVEVLRSGSSVRARFSPPPSRSAQGAGNQRRSATATFNAGHSKRSEAAQMDPLALDTREDRRRGSGLVPGRPEDTGEPIDSSPVKQSSIDAARTLANVEHTQQSGAPRPPRTLRDAPSGGRGGAGVTPGYAGEAVAQPSSINSVEQADVQPDFADFQRAAISSSEGLRDPNHTEIPREK